MKKISLMLIILVIFSLVLVGCQEEMTKGPNQFMQESNEDTAETPTLENEDVEETIEVKEDPKEELKEIEPVMEEGVVEINMIAKKWEFVPSEIKVNKGDKVKLTITSEDVGHGINIAAFGVNVKFNPGETKTVEFVADKEGTHTFFCNVYCGSGHGNMKGKLIVG